MGNRLAGKVAVVTGGSAGIGAATVDLFLSEGAEVIIADLQVDAGERIASRSGGRARFIRTDVTKEADIKAMIEMAAGSFGGLDILLNNAGAAGAMAPIADMEAADWDMTMELLPRAAMLGMKHAYPLLRARGGGSIINTASIAGMRPGISSAAYSVAKAAVMQLARMAAVEFAADNIRVNNICPGIIPTQVLGSFFGVPRDRVHEMLPDVAAIFSSAQPLQRAGSPKDVAYTALFLASDESAFTTGQDFVVDGGMMMMGPPSLDATRPDGILSRMVELAKRFQG
jgi:NAD(P)-dependent dehydrogenase (short-subunit alcohol dehydrogenase family)